jgi:hypothetical protein
MQFVFRSNSFCFVKTEIAIGANKSLALTTPKNIKGERMFRRMPEQLLWRRWTFLTQVAARSRRNRA